MESPKIIPLSQLESMLGIDASWQSPHLDAVMASPSHGQPSLPPAPVSPLPLNRPDNAWVRFEAEVRSKHAMALMKLRRLWESGGASDAELHPLLKLLDIEEQTRCQAFQACVMGEERSHVYQAVVRSIIEKLLGKLETHTLETHTPSVYQGTVQCLSDYLSALNHHCEICVVPPPPSALPAIAEGSAIGYSASQLTGYSSESASETRSHASRSEDTLSTCSAGLSDALPLGQGPLGATYHVEESRRSSFELPFDGSASGREGDRAERRRESNKKAASRYRTKKSATSSSLMADNTALRQQMSTLASQSAVLSAENKLLTQQVAFLWAPA